MTPMDEERIRRQYEEYRQEFSKTIVELRETLNNIANLFYQQTRFRVLVLEPRLKTADSIVAKLRRKDVSADSLFVLKDDVLSLAVNDFLGARISCNTREDVEQIVQLICEFSRFRLVKDPDRLNKPSGYRAVHLDVLYRDYWQDKLIFVPVEIQVKTHLQNAWADITHDESYKPASDMMSNEWERQYSRHIADVLDVLDNMASTIRQQRLNLVRPPQEIGDSDTVINSKTLSYKVHVLKRGERLTQQEMVLVLKRLKEEGFETLAEVADLLSSENVERAIREAKDKLQIPDNVKPFEQLYYGALLHRGSSTRFEEELRGDYGFVSVQCLDCQQWLTRAEYDFLRTKTDADNQYYCSEHRKTHYDHECASCGLLTASVLCKNCEAEARAP